MLTVKAGTVLHVGCGSQTLPEWVQAREEVRLDMDERNKPDIVADMRDLGDIGPFDAVFSSHVLEHVSRADALKTLREFVRVLKPGGVVIAAVPDLEGVQADDRALYESEAGPVTGADMHYGMQSLLEQFPQMAHRFGYVKDTLKALFAEAGIDATVERLQGYNLIAYGVRP